MILFIKGLENNYEIEMLSRMFFPQLSLAEDRELSSLCENEDYLFANRDITGENQQLSITLRRNGEIFSESGSMAADAAEREYNLALSRMLYRCAVKSGCDAKATDEAAKGESMTETKQTSTTKTDRRPDCVTEIR
ncbi:MAG: hypothetical protein J5968_02600, partial [Oscillospiraceae bacterium]|nr:hypothetical protein [Oscillospiraceae bacterium]